MSRIYYGISKKSRSLGYVIGLKCDDSFYVISKESYKRIKKKSGIDKPVFQTDLPVYIDGINI